MATLLRVLCADMVEHAGSGHPGMPMGMADVATVLFAKHLRFSPNQPKWPARDRFVLSAGHGSALLYALLHLIGVPEITLDQLKSLRKIGSITPGHPEYGHTPGVECTTGPLGQGIATAVGMALAQKKQAARAPSGHMDYAIYVIAGDGCLMEGISHEAASLAGHNKLDNLIVLFDDNAITIDGDTSLASSETTLKTLERFEAYGWEAWAVDGHDHEAIDKALHEARTLDRPCLIACKTVIGKGAPNKAGTSAVHGAKLGSSELSEMRDALNWPHPPFELPAPLRSDWSAVGVRGDATRETWLSEVNRPEAAKPRSTGYAPPKEFKIPSKTLEKAKTVALAAGSQATRVSSKQILDVLTADCPWLIGGSADLSGSTGTLPDQHRIIEAGDYSGNFIRYGVREHAMAAAMNGIALSEDFIPYGGTFLVFSDYCRPSIRLAALMSLKTIFVLTHDSIGLGEDGPTHQPIEHISSLQLIPNLQVLRPCDGVETLEAWQSAIEYDGPTAIVLSRQGTPSLRTDASENLSRLGAYVISDSKHPRDVTLLASGTEVSLALEVKTDLGKSGIKCAVISAPNMAKLLSLTPSQRTTLFGAKGTLCASIEAGRTELWQAILPDGSLTFGTQTFGESGAAQSIYQNFGLTSSQISKTIKAAMKRR